MVTQAASTDSIMEDYAADNFYQILGVPESASRRDIKRAYKNMMKDFHPDLSGDEESTEFCILLNEIYEVGIASAPATAPGLTDCFLLYSHVVQPCIHSFHQACQGCRHSRQQHCHGT